MRLHSLRELVKADFRMFLRDKDSLFWTFFFPIFFMGILGAVFGNLGKVTFTLGVVNLDGSQSSSELVDASHEQGIFQIQSLDNDDINQSFKNGEVDLVLVIPAGFGESFNESISGIGTEPQPGPATVYFYSSRSTSGQSETALSIGSQTVSEYNKQIIQNITQVSDVVVSSNNKVFSLDLRYIDFLAPGIVALSIMSTGVFSIVTILTTMREKHILRRIQATPLHPATLIAGLIVTRLVVALIQTAFILIIAVALFGVQIRGNFLHMLVMIIVGALGFVTIGFAISSYARTSESAYAVSNVVIMPMFFLGDTFIPISIMPSYMQPIAKAMPLSYLSDGLRSIMIFDSGLGAGGRRSHRCRGRSREAEQCEYQENPWHSVVMASGLVVAPWRSGLCTRRAEVFSTRLCRAALPIDPPSARRPCSA